MCKRNNANLKEKDKNSFQKNNVLILVQSVCFFFHLVLRTITVIEE